MTVSSSSSATVAAASSSSTFLLKLPRWADPTRAFSLLVIAIMALRYAAAHDWQFHLLVKGFFGHYQVLLALLVYSIPYFQKAWYNKNNPKSKPENTAASADVGDAFVAEWYWWNAWLYHTVMDGLSGTFHQVPVVVHQYFILDKRFETHHVVPWVIGLIELTIMAPLCFWTIYSILNQGPLRWPLELLTSTFQLFGMIVFVVSEVYEGQVNIPALDPSNGSWDNLKLFDLYHLTYYWFGFWFCNLVWGYVPIYRMVRALHECRAASTKQSQSLQQNAVSNSKSKVK